MRLWSLHPSYLDKRALQICWADSLQALDIIKEEKDFLDLSPRHHLCLTPFNRGDISPLQLIANYLHGLCDESERRNNDFGRAKLPQFTPGLRLRVTDGQIAAEAKLLLIQLDKRKQSERWMELFVAEYIQPHPLFEIVSGPAEYWEKSS